MIPMQMTAVESSNLKAYGYASDARVLRVEFGSSGAYEYLGVPPDVAEKFASAPSKGKFFASNIRGEYESRRIIEPKEEA